jgi:hypothetical protein
LAIPIADAAKMLNVSERSVNRGKVILADAPDDIKEKVEAGQMKLATAERAARAEHARREPAITRCPSHCAVPRVHLVLIRTSRQTLEREVEGSDVPHLPGVDPDRAGYTPILHQPIEFP